ncbi:MAG: hypothetical protein HYZ84_01585 [Candidatus Omnitrophica bacterium]|nr:hypothetical protein [Candidatus Omnitrophota bacterium]
MSKINVNWDNIQALSRAGINWAEIDRLSEAGVNWSDIAVLSTAGVNWTDLQSMSKGGVNWNDLALMTGAGMNWTDIAGQTQSHINWVDISKMSTTGIKWDDIKTLSGRIDAIATNLTTTLTATQTINTMMGTNTDLSTANTLFGKIAEVNAIVSTLSTSSSTASLATKLDEMKAALGSNNDLSTASTLFGRIAANKALANDVKSLLGLTTDAGTVSSVFGRLKGIDGKIGSSTDTKTSTTTLFGKIAGLPDTLANLDGTAATILQEVQDMRSEVGAEGGHESIAAGVDRLKSLLEDLKNVSAQVEEKATGEGEVAADLINTLVEAVNKSAESIGIVGSQVEKLTAEEGAYRPVVDSKLEELKSYLLAIKDAMNIKEELKEEGRAPSAVVQAWIE